MFNLECYLSQLSSLYFLLISLTFSLPSKASASFLRSHAVFTAAFLHTAALTTIDPIPAVSLNANGPHPSNLTDDKVCEV